MADVTVVIGAGSMGVAIARRISDSMHVLLADLNLENADAAPAQGESRGVVEQGCVGLRR